MLPFVCAWGGWCSHLLVSVCLFFLFICLVCCRLFVRLCFALFRFALFFVLHLFASLFAFLTLIRFDSLFVAMHCCFVLCLALLRFCCCFALPTKAGQRPNSPTARRLHRRNSPTGKRANGPTGQRASGPTGQRANDPNVASIPLIKSKVGQPFLLIIAEHVTAESARKSAAGRLPLFSLRKQRSHCFHNSESLRNDPSSETGFRNRKLRFHMRK